MGYRYRLGGCGLLGKPDIVFFKKRLAVFVHGCFWHCHDCRFFKWPATNSEFWRVKIESNARRDESVVAALRSMNWRVLVVWECELRETAYAEPNLAVLRVATALDQQAIR